MFREITLAAAMMAAPTGAWAQESGRPHSAGAPYAATGLPDRVVLTPAADPARGMAVAYRTDARQAEAVAELVAMREGPVLDAGARTIRGHSFDITTENGAARYHQLRFDALESDTVYAYRVQGPAGWTEWHQFRTAAATFRPFTFLYFGDTQNNILSIGSRVIRQAFAATAGPALALHAGDLVAQREEKVHDDEWGEWAEAGGFHYAMTPQIVAAGNHEYVNVAQVDGTERRVLGPHWTRAFALPGNGAEAAKSTSYFVDYQDVRFVVLDGTAAIDLGALDGQTRWLETVLQSEARWTVVLMHQPLFTCARPNDTPLLKSAWQSVFERHGVDLVLQGHDHCYSRLTAPEGRAASAAARAGGAAQGPVYMVSVVGSKMYALNDRADTQPDRVAEETQLYQTVHVEADRLAVRVFTANGRPYDGFDIVREPGGNRLVETGENFGPVRRCADGIGPDGVPCTAEVKD